MSHNTLTKPERPRSHRRPSRITPDQMFWMLAGAYALAGTALTAWLTW